MGNDKFTIDIDGAYVSSFLLPIIERVAPFVNDGGTNSEKAVRS